MESGIASLQSAASALEDGRYQDVLRLLETPSDSSTPVAKSLWYVASAIVAERRGDSAAAEKYFQLAHESRVPLPAVVLACARHFKKSGQYEKAYHDFSILQNIVPGAIEEFLRDLPSSELCRYSTLMISKMLHAPRPNLYGLQTYKEALGSQFGAEEAGLAWAKITKQKPGWSIATLPLVGLRDYAERKALDFQSLVAGKQTLFPPPEVFPRTDRQGFSVKTRDFFLCLLADAVVACKSNIVLAGDVALLDFQNDELPKAPLDLRIDPVVFGATDDKVTVLRAAPSEPELEQALSLNGIHSYAFGHWILEFLPKVWACLDRPGFESVTLLIDEQMPPQHVQALKLFVGDQQPIRALKPGESVRVRKLLVCSMIVYMPHGSKPGAEIATDARSIDGGAYASLVEKVRPKLEAIPAAHGAKRIYLTRKDSQHRRLINARETEAWCVEHGFGLYDFADIPFVEQIALIRGADVVVGPHGSAFLAAFFARPGTRIGIFNHEYLDDFEWYSEAFRSLGLRHSILVGDTVNKNVNYLTFSDYRIDLDSLADFLRHLQSIP